jgi:hypothetical protein
MLMTAARYVVSWKVGEFSGVVRVAWHLSTFAAAAKTQVV